MARKLSTKEQAVVYAMGLKRRDEFQKIVNGVVPCVYAAVAISLHEQNWEYEQINDLFVRSQEIWNEYCEEPGDMTDKCYELTGIDVMDKSEF